MQRDFVSGERDSIEYDTNSPILESDVISRNFLKLFRDFFSDFIF